MCEISIINVKGKVLLDELIKPSKPIPDDAIAIHGITNEMVKDASPWPEIHKRFCSIIKDKTLIIYNSSYDTRIIDQTIAFNTFESEEYRNWNHYKKTFCAMELFAAYYGYWDDYRENWKWQKLTTAANHMKVKTEGKAHRSLADCRMTLGVIQAMADKVPENPERKVSKSK